VSAASVVSTRTGRADQGRLYEEHALALQAVVGRRVHTSPVNVEDACGFAWLQLVRRGNRPASAFAWLCTIAIREALKLHRRAARTTGLDEVADAATDPRYDVDWRVELIGAGEEIRQARLQRREARLVGLRAAGYSRDEMVEVTGDTCRTVDRQLARAQRKLRDARRAGADVRALS
jgi:DNA-directed RNA polymerase specialized sigma24 family protein